MVDELLDIKTIKRNLHNFAKEREWEKFHSPKNLSMALSCESAELLEHFQWLTEEQSKKLSPETLTEVGEEIADILLYAFRLCDVLDLDVSRIVEDKFQKNIKKYPVELARGIAKKYTKRE